MLIVGVYFKNGHPDGKPSSCRLRLCDPRHPSLLLFVYKNLSGMQQSSILHRKEQGLSQIDNAAAV